MGASRRTVLPEILDELDPDDPQARRSRQDLQRIHRAMGTVTVMTAALADFRPRRRPLQLLELGAGDGSLLLRLARALAGRWPEVELTLLDRKDLVSPATRDAFRRLGWNPTVVTTDVLDWARAPGASRHYDLCLAALFLHHFEGPELAAILAAVAARSDALVACEPRRDAWSWLGSRLVGVIGGNRITRSDAVTSVAAGFAARELGAAWPDPQRRWALEEWRAFPFTHVFSARAMAPPPQEGR